MDNISRQKIQALEKMLGEDGPVAVTAHMRPDGDAVGSCVAMYHILKDAGRDARIVLPDRSPECLAFLTGTVEEGRLLIHEDDRTGAEAAISGCSLLFCLDYNAFHRTGEMEAALGNSMARKILIDHHLNPSHELFDLVFSETEISSTAEYLYYIMMATERFGQNPGKLPPDAALALMTGMTTDTNNFANSVYPSTLEMASSLLGAGVDRDMMIGHLYNEYREERIRLMGELLSRGLKITSYGVAYMVLDKETIGKYNLQEGETEGFVNIPLSIGKVKLSCFFKEDKDRIRVSLRSKKGISANRCAAEYFHGGGHELAAGGRLTVPDDVRSIHDVPSYVEKVTREFMSTGSNI